MEQQDIYFVAIAVLLGTLGTEVIKRLVAMAEDWNWHRRHPQGEHAEAHYGRTCQCCGVVLPEDCTKCIAAKADLEQKPYNEPLSWTNIET